MELNATGLRALEEVERQARIFRMAVWDTIATYLRENPTIVYADAAARFGCSLATITRVAKLNNIKRHGNKEKK